MEATSHFFPSSPDHFDYLRETYDLLTLVNQSYQALDIGNLHHIHELQWAIEDVSSIRKRVMEKQCPPDSDSLGLVASMTSSEEVDTFERMVSFFHKKKPMRTIPWDIFTIEDGQIFVKESALSNQRDNI